MKRFISITPVGIMLLLVAGCGHGTHPSKLNHPVAEPAVDNVAPAVVALQIQPVGLKVVRTNTVTTWLATYGSGPQSARFELELEQGEMHKPSAHDKKLGLPDFETGEGAFIHVSGSHSAGLIQALAKVLESKSVPTKLNRKSRLSFSYVVLGENQSRGPDGSFADSPPGAWRPMKFFLGGDDGEFFFNMNPQTGQAEFTEKDPDYGDYDVKQLASVL